MELIQTKHVSFTYPEQREAALIDINLTVEKGDFFVLCGYSGSGKSTLLRHLKPALSPFGALEGTILFKGEPLDKLSSRESASSIGFVMQSPDHQVVTDKVWHELAFGLESLGLETSVIRRRTSEMAAFFGIENWYYKNVSELSGGQKQLLSLASVMAMQPEVLILDEPTAQLDPIAASEFLGALKKINTELGTTILLSEHRLEEALTMATKAAVMEKGRILCMGEVQEIGSMLKERDSKMFLAMPTAMQVWASVESSLPCPISVKEGREFVREYTKWEDTSENIRTLERKSTPKMAGEEMIFAENVWFRYESDLPDVIKGLNFSASRGELFCILGGNGSGKTTALKLLCGLKNPYRGEISKKGHVGMLPQDPQTVFVKKTVKEDLEDVLRNKNISNEEKEKEILKIADLCRITQVISRHPYDLSGGEQQRAALAKILLLSPEILLVDEPTKGLDMPFKIEFAEILQNLKNRGVCIVMVSHDIEFCGRYADRCSMFFDGQIAAEDTPAEFFAGNSFYTTAANRIMREIEPTVVTTEDAITVIGGRCPKSADEEVCREESDKTDTIVDDIDKKEAQIHSGKLPLWRKVGAMISAFAAICVFLYAAKSENLRNYIDQDGLTGQGKGQLLLYGVFMGLLVLLACFLGQRDRNHFRKEKQKGKLPRRTIFATIIILLLVPVTLYVGIVHLNYTQYYITAFAVLIECMMPFFFIFEGRHPKARELVTISSLCALAVAGRAAFFMLPQFKPVMAITILAGVALGGECGFLVGAVSMLVSNIMFSQGPWTPWQMFAMGIIGFLAGILYKKGLLRRSKWTLSIFGALCAIFIYGGIMNPASALIWGSETLNLKIIMTYYITGFPMDVIQAGATAIFLWFGAEPMLEKLDRIKVKYGMMEGPRSQEKQWKKFEK